MEIQATTRDAYDLFHRGAIALSEVTMNGICVDYNYCKRIYKQLKRDIKKLEDRLMDYEEVQEWSKKYGSNFKFDSDDQLRDILFGVFDNEPTKLTDTGQPSLNQEALEMMNLDFTNDYIRRKNLIKARNTYFKNILLETMDGKLHPNFLLNLVRTYRSSSKNINFQNIPIRDAEIGPVVRAAFKPSPGNRLLEIDYGGIEVKGACWYHQDPVMLDYLWDSSKDMHRDMAMECYILESLDKSNKNEKDIRYCGKNKFVFPEFYGDYYASCARSLWASIDQMKLALKDGTPLRKHLRQQGIKNYQMFEDHIRKIEDKFWNERFQVYKKWKDRYLNEYDKTGKIKLLTGFECKGVMKKNNVINYPVQGVSFHVLLWSLIEINEILKKENWKSRIIGQIHDCIMFDAHPKEVKKLLKLCYEVMCLRIKEHWKFINTPLEIEADITPIDGTWAEKKGIPIPDLN